MVYLLHSIQDSEDQRDKREKENNLVSQGYQPLRDDPSKKSERKSEQKQVEASIDTTSDVNMKNAKTTYL